MSNEYYDHGTVPANASALSSAAMRAEFDAVEAGFSKLPVLTGNALKPVRVNAAGNALEASSQIDGVDIGTNTPGIGSFTTLSTNDVASITANSASPALRVTQTGSGDALLVEDSANPDSTPFVIDAEGNVLTGIGAASSIALGVFRSNPSIIYHQRYSADATGPAYYFSKTRAATPLAYDIVSNNDSLGTLFWAGSDGVDNRNAASISAAVDGTPGASDMPGRLIFSTTADGSITPTERMRIDSAGRLGIGVTPPAGQNVRIGAPMTGAASAYSLLSLPTIQSDVVNIGFNIASQVNTAAAAFTLAQLRHFTATQGTIGAGSSITNQYGFYADAGITGATNNYGFFSNIASGTGRWNFYAAGTADNYFGGPTTVSVNSTSDAFKITQAGTGNALLIEDVVGDTTPLVIDNAGRLAIGTTTPIGGYSSVNPFFQMHSNTGQAGASIALSSWINNTGSATRLIFQKSNSGTTGTYGPSAAAANTLVGSINFTADDSAAFRDVATIEAYVDGSPGLNDMPGRLMFSTTPDGSTTPQVRMTIKNDGSVGIGTTAPGALLNVVANSSSDALRITQTGTGNALVVEDSANPDSTPFVIDQSGSVVVGHTARVTNVNVIEAHSTAAVNQAPGIAAYSWQASSTGAPSLGLYKSRGGAAGVNGIVASGDATRIPFNFDDGTQFLRAAEITAQVDGTPGLNDMPGRLVFSTTADGSASPTERMRIDSAGRIGINTASINLANRIQVTDVVTDATAFSAYYQANASNPSGGGSLTAFNILAVPTVAWGSTGAVVAVSGGITNQNAGTVQQVRGFTSTFTSTGGGTVTDRYGYFDQGLTLTSGAVTNNYAFFAVAGSGSATNNYGFFSNYSAGTGRWNFYANGTADNFFAGDILKGSNTKYEFAGFIPGIQSHNTGSSGASIGLASWQVGTNVAANLYFGRGDSGAIGNFAVVDQNDYIGNIRFTAADGVKFAEAAKITAEVDGAPGIDDMPGRLAFWTSPDGSATPVERMRIDSEGRIGVGTTPTVSAGIHSKAVGNTSSPIGVLVAPLLSSVATGSAVIFDTIGVDYVAGMGATALYHYRARPADTFGGGTTSVSNQYGFFVDSRLTQAINNYGFYSGIVSSTGRWNFYAAGTAANYFAGDVYIGQNTTPIPGLSNTTVGIAFDAGFSGYFSRNSGAAIFCNVNAPATAIASFRKDGDQVASITANGGIQVSTTNITSPVANDGNVFSGTYTPTLTSVANVTGSTAYVCQYTRVGNVVTVSGYVDINATVANTDTVLGISLPVASNFSSVIQLGGAGACASAARYGVGAAIVADATNDRAELRVRPTATGALAYSFTFTYQVL